MTTLPGDLHQRPPLTNITSQVLRVLSPMALRRAAFALPGLSPELHRKLVPQVRQLLELETESVR